jgi:uncharacterized membrane protein
MSDIEALLNRWQSAGVLDAVSAARIRAHELQFAAKDSPGLRWQGVTALILGAILLACGVALFVSSHWNDISPGARYALVMAMVAVFHIGGGLARANWRGLSTALHAVGTLAVGPAIALVGQIFNIEAHWPTAVLVWALAALVGWLLLRDQAQQTLALMLVPAWMICEIAYYADNHIGAAVYIGRALFVWAVLYLTFFAGSRHKFVQGILFAASAIAAVVGVVLMLVSWASWSATQSFIPFSTTVWAWIAIAAVPLVIAAFHGHKGLIPIAAAIAFVIALPWCYRTQTQSNTDPSGMVHSYSYTVPNLMAHALVAAFAVFLCVWGVRVVSRALVNLGIVGFAAAVAWFYFSDVYSALGRSMGLIGLGILFLAGGWALEKTRRRILSRIVPGPAAPPTQSLVEAQ